jgi:DNA-binding response OmpR family regulator
MRILIIEDDRESADYLVKAFREVGYVADLASDGEEGLSLADSGDYDVLVVDRMLPKRDGLSLIGALREKGNRTPVLILSALGQVDDRIKGLRAGGDDYLPKPYAFAELLARVEAVQAKDAARLLAHLVDLVDRQRPQAEGEGGRAREPRAVARSPLRDASSPRRRGDVRARSRRSKRC